MAPIIHGAALADPIGDSCEYRTRDHQIRHLVDVREIKEHFGRHALIAEQAAQVVRLDAVVGGLRQRLPEPRVAQPERPVQTWGL
jgi:hypothetical protein